MMLPTYFSCTSSGTRSLKSGFTLIELLVVIAIIGLLAAILFPVFARARENARRTACLSNLKQVNLGMMQYIQDFDESYPPAIIGGNAWGPVPATGHSWAFAIEPYVKSVAVYKCPSEFVKAATNQNFQPGRDIPRSYYPVIQFRDDASNANSAVMMDYDVGQKLAAIPKPSETVWLLESGNNQPWTNDNLVVSNHGLFASDRGNFSKYGSWHFDGCSFAFADGHVKWMLPRRAVDQAWPDKDLLVRIK